MYNCYIMDGDMYIINENFKVPDRLYTASSLIFKITDFNKQFEKFSGGIAVLEYEDVVVLNRTDNKKQFLKNLDKSCMWDVACRFRYNYGNRGEIKNEDAT